MILVTQKKLLLKSIAVVDFIHYYGHNQVGLGLLVMIFRFFELLIGFVRSYLSVNRVKKKRNAFK